MFSKSNLFATLAGFVVLLLLGFLFYAFLAENFFESHTINKVLLKDDESLLMPFLMLGSLLFSFFMATIYGKWSRGHHSIKEGFSFGALIGGLTGFGIGLIQYATVNFMDLNAYLINGVWEIIYYGIAGAVIAFVYKFTSN